MGIFRKKETYNEQMLREAGLDRVRFREPEPPPAPEPAAGADDPPAIALRRPREFGRAWDAVEAVTVPGIQGDEVTFWTLPNGDLVVGEESGDGNLSALADAVESSIQPPYKAVASRQDGDLWGVGAKRIEVATIPFPGGDALDLSQIDGVAELDVDGEPSDAAPPVELQRLGERVGGDFSVQATRIDGDDWEVKVSPL